MNKRVVLATSTGCIDYGPERYRNLGIEFVRITVCYGGKEYLEGLDLNPKEFFEMEQKLKYPEEPLPYTAMPSVESIQKTYESLIEKGVEEVFVITLSSYLGGTLNELRLVSEDYKDRLKFHFVDTKTTCFCEGMLQIQCAELINKGVDSETIIKELNWSIAHEQFIGICTDLKFLIYNGRLKGGKAFISRALGICPVMHFDRDGVIDSFATAIGAKAGAIKAIQEVKRIIGDRDPKDYYLWHNYAAEGSADILKELEGKYGLECNHEDVIGSPVTGCHTGPGLVSYGLFFKRRDDEPLE